LGDRSGRQQESGAAEVPWLASGQSEKPRELEEGALGTNWEVRSRQKDGRVTEKKLAKELGAKVHPASGALRIKNDASDDEVLYEIKDANKSYTLTAGDLHQLWKEAVKQDKEPVFIVQFMHKGMRATMAITKEVGK